LYGDGSDNTTIVMLLKLKKKLAVTLISLWYSC